MDTVNLAAEQLAASTAEARRWAVARTKPQAERWAHLNLLRIGYEAFLPLCTVRRRDRVVRSLIHTVEQPLFRSYLFVQHQLGTSWRPIRSAPGVSTLITVGGRLEYAAPGAVEALQETEQLRRAPTTQEGLFRPGSACRLNGGPLKGHEAAVVAVTGDNVVVTVMLFGELRHISVALNALSLRDD
jgi:transcription antitermination factor NusG